LSVVTDGVGVGDGVVRNITYTSLPPNSNETT